MRSLHRNVSRPSKWLIQFLFALLVSLQFQSVEAKIGESREEMIRRLGTPTYEIDTYCHFSLGEVDMSARFYEGNCFEIEYEIGGVKARRQERVKRINSLLMEASGGREWNIADLSGGGVIWETADGKLEAILENREESGGTKDDPETLLMEYLTITDLIVDERRREEVAEKIDLKQSSNRKLFFVLIIPALLISILIWRRRNSTHPKILGVSCFIAAALYPYLIHLSGIFEFNEGLFMLLAFGWILFAGRLGVYMWEQEGT
jgi:hypothetical protein